jgi:spermidine/putrescine transport system permease protein
MKLKSIIIPYSIWMIIFIVVPLFLVIFFSFTNFRNEFTLENILNTGKYSSVFLRSIILGFVSTLICLVFGYPAAYFMSKISDKNQNILLILLMIPLCLSFLLKTYAWMTILENNGILNKILVFCGFAKINIINSQIAIIIGMVYNFLPYMILPIYTIFKKINKNLIEAAQDLGANKFQTFIKVVFPFSIPAVISGITMVFVPAVSTFIISKMLGGGADILIGDLIEMQFLGNTYNPHLGSAISLVLMFIIMICISIFDQFDSENFEVLI